MRKYYVLDTNVLIHDPNSLYHFEDNHVVIPMVVLEELDKLKGSKISVSRECRMAIKNLDRILSHARRDEVAKGVPILREDGRDSRGTLSVLSEMDPESERQVLDASNNDNLILRNVLFLVQRHPRNRVILVSQDINMRLKAKALGIEVEDYHNDQVISDVSYLRKGYVRYPGDLNATLLELGLMFRPDEHHRHVSISVPRTLLGEEVTVNSYVYDHQEFVGRVVEAREESVEVRLLHAGSLLGRKAWGLMPKNMEQAFALDALLDEHLQIVTLTGQAGSGKTILALAAALELTIEKKRYNKIIVTRSTPSLAEEHGFLPGTEEEKMDPWLGAINDNLEALHKKDAKPLSSVDFIKSKANIQFKALNYIRGRSFQDAFLLIDECQNLTPHQMKTIITRAGEGTKVVCLGNLSQIDAHYLSALSSGLTYMSEKFKNYPFGAHVHLEGSPRSHLAEYAERVL